MGVRLVWDADRELVLERGGGGERRYGCRQGWDDSITRQGTLENSRAVVLTLKRLREEASECEDL